MVEFVTLQEGKIRGTSLFKELSRVLTSHLLPELFDGQILACNASSDCLGGLAVCTGDLSSTPNTVFADSFSCVCPTDFVRAGPSCDGSILGSPSLFVVVMSFVCAVISFVVSFYGTYLLVSAGRSIKAGSALQTTLAAASLGLFWLGAEYVHEAVCFLTNDRVCKSMAVLDRIAISMMFLFCSMAALNISLLWLEVAANSRKMSNRRVSNVSKYRYVLWGYNLTATVAMVVLMILDRPDAALYVVAPAIVFIVISYAVGLSKMRSLLISSSSSAVNKSEGKGMKASKSDHTIQVEENAAKLSEKYGERTYRSMRFASLGIITGGIVLAVCGVTLAIVELPPLESSPLFPTQKFVLWFIFTSAMVMEIFVVHYCSQYITKSSPGSSEVRVANKEIAATLTSREDNAVKSGSGLDTSPTENPVFSSQGN